MKLHREVAIPDRLREARLFVRMLQDHPDKLLLQAALGPSDATHQIIDAAGRPLITHLSERDETVSATLMRQNVWEYLTSLALLGVARPGMTFLDIGANVGYFSVLLARAIQPAGQVHAFEPEPNNARILTANALLTREIDPLSARITPWGLALSDESGPATLDGLRFPENGQGPLLNRRIDLLKADTQGVEMKILRGGRRTLSQDRPVLCLALQPNLSGAPSCVELVRALEDFGYHAFRLFHSTTIDPYCALMEFGETRTADDVVALVERQAVGAHGTLFAYPPAPPFASVAS